MGPTEIAEFHHGGTIFTLAISADGKEVAAGDLHEIRLWSCETGKLNRATSQSARLLAYNPRRPQLALVDAVHSATDLVLWDSEFDVSIRSFLGARIRSLLYSPDGSMVVTCGDSHGWSVLRRSEPVNGQITTSSAAEMRFGRVSISGDSQLLVGVANDGPGAIPRCSDVSPHPAKIAARRYEQGDARRSVTCQRLPGDSLAGRPCCNCGTTRCWPAARRWRLRKALWGRFVFPVTAAAWPRQPWTRAC